MKQLFNSERPAKAYRAYRVENINPEKGITASLRVSEDRRDFVVCLCLPTKTVKTTVHNEALALHEMKRYKELYKPLKKKNAKSGFQIA